MPQHGPAGDPHGRQSGGKLTQEKAKEILSHGEVRGHPLTPKQKGLFGARAGGAKLQALAERRKARGKK